MILDDLTIRKLGLITGNFVSENLQPASYDLTLDTDKNIFIAPGRSVLVSTKERVELPDNVVGFLKDKSTLLRQGIRIGQGYVDPGFKGTLTISVSNLGRSVVTLSPEELFCQIVFVEVKHSTSKPYNGHYQNQSGVTEAVK